MKKLPQRSFLVGLDALQPFVHLISVSTVIWTVLNCFDYRSHLWTVEMISLRVHVARKPDCVTSEQHRCRTEYASAQSDHRFYFSLSYSFSRVVMWVIFCHIRNLSQLCINVYSRNIILCVNFFRALTASSGGGGGARAPQSPPP